MRDEEHKLQVTIVKAVRSLRGFINDIDLIHSIPNGGQRHIRVAVKLKAEGALAGVPDLFIPMPYGEYHGLYMEVKTAKGVLSASQKVVIPRLERQGYKVVVVRSVKDALDAVMDYFKIKF